jgi:predicted metal-dependent peptidase
MNASEKLKKARVALLLDQPFFATLALRLEYLPDNSIPSASTNGVRVRYNTRYVEKLSIDQLQGVLAHIVMHGALLHHTRRGERGVARWNRATDYAINPLLLSSGFVLPDDYLFDAAYKDKGAEDIYALLPQLAPEKEQVNGSPSNSETQSFLSTSGDPATNVDDSTPPKSEQASEPHGIQTLPPTPGNQEGDDSGANSTGAGDPRDPLPISSTPTPPHDLSERANHDQPGIADVEDVPAGVDRQQLEAEMKQALVDAANVARRQGKLPAYMDRLITELLQPRIDWRESLSRFLTETAPNDYTWTKPSPRYLHSRIYLPSLESEETGSVILLVDTSGSIDEKMINQFAAEVQEITATFQIALKVIYVDADIQGVQDIDPDETVTLKPQGGGETDFRPGFEYIDQEDLQPKAVIYLTDGLCDSFPEIPDYPVLWAQFGDYPFDPPFGEVIQIT